MSGAVGIGGGAAMVDLRETLVVKLGGTTLSEQRGVLGEIAGAARRGPVVVVHGGGQRLGEWLDRLGVASRFEEGLRVTDEAAIEVTAAVLRGAVNTELVAALQGLGCDAVGLSGVDGGLLAGRRLPAMGLVATVAAVRRDLLAALLAAGHVPVVAPLALDEDGIACNVNADDVAAGIARGIGARRLVLLTDTDGILDAIGRRIPTLTAAGAESLIGAGVIATGMVPKVRAALRALDGDPAAVAVIADGSAERALARALDDPAFGTRFGPAVEATAR